MDRPNTFNNKYLYFCLITKNYTFHAAIWHCQYKNQPDLIFCNLVYFLCSQLVFVFHLLEDFCIVYKHFHAFCLFLLQKDSYVNQDHISAFLFCFFLGRFWYLSRAFFEGLLCSYSVTIFIYSKRLYKKYINSFFYPLKN